MKRLKKKILGILLSIVMVLGLMPGMSLVTDAANSVTDTIPTVVLGEPQGVGCTFHGPHCDITAGCANEGLGIRLGGNDTAVFAADQGFVITEISFNNGGNPGGVLTTTKGVVSQSGTTYTISGINNHTVTLGATLGAAGQPTGQPIWFTSVDVTLSEENTPGTNPGTGITLPETVYVTGTFNDWTTGSSDYAMTKEGSVCTITVKGVEAGDHVFKFCGTDWDEFDYGVDEDLDVHSSTGVEVGRFYAARQGGANIRFTTTEKSDVTVIFDASGATPRFKIGDISPSGSKEASTGSAYVHTHHKCEDGHKFSFQVLEAATTEKDGIGMWCCERCGIPDWNEHENAAPGEKVVISAYTVFNDTLENNIKAAESGATVSITTSRWVSVRRGVLEALAEKPGVTLTVNFEYQGMGYVIAIPGGDPALAGILASEDRFFGLMNLGNTYGLTAVEK